MSQHDYVIENQTFPATRTDLNNVFAAIVSQNSGSTAPSTTYAYQLWYDTTTDILKMRNANDDAWVNLFTIDQVADTANASVAGVLSGSNLIINGSMQVAQRGTSGASGNGYNSVDRFRVASGSTDEWALTQTQETDAPTGFSKSTKYTCTTAETTLASDEWAAIQYTFEGQDLQHLSYGSASAQSVTLSFWVKSSTTGTFGVSIYQPRDNRIIGSTYTIASANTWEQKIITFAGDTTGIIDNVNTEGLRIYWFLAAGSGFTSTDNTSWKTYAGTDLAYGHAVNLIDSTLDNFYLTGVQLELGEQATPFEHRSYGDELQRCRRYYQKLVGASYYGGFHPYTGSTGHYVQLVPSMRAAPTVTNYNVRNASTGATASNQSASYINVDGFNVPVDGAGGVDTNVSHINQTFLEASAEL